MRYVGEVSMVADGPLTLSRSSLPELYRTAADQAARQQRRYLVSTFAELFFLLLAAAFTLAPGQVAYQGYALDLTELGAILSFAVALGLRLLRLLLRPDQRWYQSRTVAEGVKGQGWRFAVRGRPYDDTAGDEVSATAQFRVIFDKFLEQSKDLRLHLPADPTQITETMRRVRSAPLAQRIAVYLQDRLQDQREFYIRKGRQYSGRAWRLNALIVVLELGGALAAVAKVLTLLPVDPLGIAATLVAAVATWLQARQYTIIARNYGAMARQLSIVNDGALALQREVESSQAGANPGMEARQEARWADVVDDVETLLANEHEEWQLVIQPVKQQGRSI
jgi:hypothetical protein